MSALISLFDSPNSLLPLQSGPVGQTQVTAAQAVVRGLSGKCPNCGRGHMFSRFLKVVDRCPTCGEELFHHRADDFPAYLVILLVGHIVVPSALLVEANYAPAMWLQFAVWMPLTIALALGLLQPVKGAIVAVQWFAGMHGFGEQRAAKQHPALTRSILHEGHTAPR
jgi:uncharacterized protein (DUF983 family)